MAKIQNQHQIVTGITSANYTTAANAVKVDNASLVTVTGNPTVAGSPTAGTLEYTIDPFELIDAGTAVWFTDFSAAAAAAFARTSLGPVSGIRINVAASGGTWTLTVRQCYDASKTN